VIIDFSNVEKWKEKLALEDRHTGIGGLAKHFSKGDIQLRRFYYGSDYGNDGRSNTLTFLVARHFSNGKNEQI